MNTPKIENAVHTAQSKAVELRLANTTHPRIAQVIVAVAARCPDAATITVSFAGSGDSGDIQGSCVTNSAGGNVRDELTQDELTQDEGDAILEFFSTNCSCDWVNGDGGGGEVIINMAAATVELNSFYNELREVPDDVTVTFALLGDE